MRWTAPLRPSRRSLSSASSRRLFAKPWPAWRRGARRHHGRSGGQDRFHRDGRVLGVRSAGDASGLPQPPQQQRAAAFQNGVFCINTLGAAELNLADIFAGRSGVHLEERFSVGEWLTLKTGSPVLASAVVAFDCRTIEIKAVASHNVYFGAVQAVRLGPGGPALGLSRSRLQASLSGPRKPALLRPRCP